MILTDTSLHSWLQLIVYVLLPLVVALVTKMSTHPGAKALILLALSAITGFVTEWAHALANNNVGFSLRLAIINMIVGFVIAVAVQRGLWRPTTISRRLAFIGPRDESVAAA